MNLIDNIPIQVIKSNRKTVSVEVKTDGIIVRAPYRMGKQAIHAFLLEKKSWIETNYKIMQERAKNWGDLEPFTDAEIDELAEKALTVIPQKVKQYAKKLGVTTTTSFFSAGLERLSSTTGVPDPLAYFALIAMD